MKLLSKLTFYITLSKLAIVILFILLLPFMIERIAFQSTNNYLKEQKKKVLKEIADDGIDYYLQGEKSYGSYTLLKEEYIALEPTGNFSRKDTIETEKRIIENDTLNYRILSHTFKAGGQNYLLEIGKTIESINQYNRPLQRIALYVLTGLIIFSFLLDLIYTRLLLKPLGLIIKNKLEGQKFPFNEQLNPTKTTTSDFKYLDASLTRLMGQINKAFDKEREFTANASHELMTPISILKSKLENLLVEPDISESMQLRLLEMMRTLGRLKKIVQSLLLISRIDNEQFVKGEQVNPKKLISEVMEELEHRLEENKIRFEMNLSDELILKNINHDLLFQLFYNLINNAIRYNKPDGSIFVYNENVDGQYAIKIEDAGIGIPKTELNTIFNRFKRYNRTETEGFGLGLAIVKSIADYLNLKIRIESEFGAGTTFTILFT